MKTLVIQLARFGDLYQTWPVLRALKSEGHEVHVLCRSKFSGGLKGLDQVDGIIELDSKDVLRGVLANNNVGESLFVIDDFIETVRKSDFDKVINLSFSPLSSYLTYELSKGIKEVRGYSRFEDDYLRIDDDASAYFFAQTGPGKANNFGVTDLFAQVAQVTLSEDDWLTEYVADESKTRPVVVCHLGASQAKKSFSPKVIAAAIDEVSNSIDIDVVLIGSKAEEHLASEFFSSSKRSDISNLVGKTRIEELFNVIGNADVLIGADSAPMHIASLVNTQALNLSCKSVSFRETGPRSWGSRVLMFETPSQASSEKVAVELRSMLNGSSCCYSPVVLAGDARTYVDVNGKASSFEARLINAIYMQSEFPEADYEVDFEIVKQLKDANALLLENLRKIGDQVFDNQTGLIIGRVESLFSYVEQNFPRWAPLMSWLSCEKLRVGPADMQQIIVANIRIHQILDDILTHYEEQFARSKQEGSGRENRANNAKRN